ncbi:MAG: MerR family transcriptional regulator [Firmicutes bacterium HGW-Firmicutes-7]|nr:MAG: MerR family transcriptional regulator [Firmicutes bacterium HGW-Firmicutes-7]
MFRIGEFSKLTQVSIRMLRYYDEMDLLKPAKIDEFTGYRLFSVEQIPLLHKIIFLRDTGFTVAEITAAVRKWDNEFITNQLQNKKQEIISAIKHEQERLDKIDIALNDLQEEKIAIHYNVSLKSIPCYQVMSLRKIIPNYFCEGMLWKELSDFVEKENIHILQNSFDFAIYHDVEYKEDNVDVEVCIVVNQNGKDRNGVTFRETEKIDTMACTMVYGPFENIAVAYESFAHWLIQQSKYKMTGQSRQICHRGPWNEKDSEKYLTELQIPVEIK